MNKSNSFFYLIFLKASIINSYALLENSTSSQMFHESSILHEFKCQMWNASIYVGSNSPLKIVSITFDVFEEQKYCFSSYEISLYRLWQGYIEKCNPFKATRIDVHVIRHHHNQVLSTIFKDLRKGYFCVLISPCNKLECFESWSLHSNVVSIKEKKILKPLKPNESKSLVPEIISVIVIFFFVISFGSWMFWKYKRRNARRKPSLPNKKSVEEVPLLAPKNIDIFIFYLQEPKTKENVILLKNFLKDCAGFNVSLIDDMLAEICINPVKWLNEILSYKCSEAGKCNSNKRFIIVEPKSKSSAMKYTIVTNRNITESTDSIASDSSDDDMQDNWFHFAVNTISIDWTKAFKDYHHLFVVHFNDFCNEDKSLNIVPSVRFKLPEDLIHLCINLNHSFANTRHKEQLQLLLDQHPIKYLNCD